LSDDAKHYVVRAVATRRSVDLLHFFFIAFSITTVILHALLLLNTYTSFLHILDYYVSVTGLGCQMGLN